MRRRLFILLLAAAPAGLTAEKTPESEIRQISTDDLKKIVEAKGGALYLLDVREPKEIEELGTLKGAVNIPLGQVEKRFSEAPKDREIIVLCNRGVRAAKAAAVLRRNGYESILGAAGLLEWRDRGWPLVHPKAESK